MPNDLDRAKEELTRTLREELGKVVAAAAADLQTLTAQLSADAVAALAEGRVDLFDEIRGQARALAEVNRLRLAHAEWNVFDSIIGAALRGLVIGATMVAKSDEPTDTKGNPA